MLTALCPSTVLGALSMPKGKIERLDEVFLRRSLFSYDIHLRVNGDDITSNGRCVLM